MKITTKQLVKAGACHDQVKLFRKHFGHGGTVTLQRCLGHAGEFDWDWAASHLLSNPARDAYNAAIKPARDAYDAAYDAAIKPARDAYYAAIEPARDVYNDAYYAAIEPARDVYNAAYYAAIKPARDAYDAAKARAFYEAASGKYQ